MSGIQELLLLQIFLILRSQSKQSYLVGGCVRDFLIGLDPKDYDIVTDIPLGDLQYLFSGWNIATSGMNFLVMNVSKDGYQFEIANFRKDGSYSDGRRPESVEVGSIFDDANRRDFTINSLYLDPFSESIIDPTGKGLTDLNDRILRFVGNPEERIKEDRLRIIRFYRFLAKGFDADPRSLRACRKLFRESYPMINPERVRGELEKL